MPLQTGQTLLNRYRIVKLLGQGGFGAVYRAWDVNLAAPCAVKENIDSSEEAVRQFENEASILSNLRHPSLPAVTDHFIIQGQGQYLVMDYIEGEDLQEKIEDVGGPLSEKQVIPWIEQICDALTYLHEQNPPIIHRDIKPANIKITPDGVAMLVDFGIAKIYDPHLRTTIGARAVTPGFSPHEQYGQGKTDARTDVYALGACLYALLTGREPEESIQRVLTGTLTPPEQINPAISKEVAGIIKKAMQVDPTNRFQNTAAFKTALLEPPLVVTTLPISQPPPTLAAAGTQPAAIQQTPFQPAPSTPIPSTNRLSVFIGLVIIGMTIAYASSIWPDGFGPSVRAVLPVSRSEFLTPTSKLIVEEEAPTETVITLTPIPESREPTAGPVDDGMEMVPIPAGEFEMGSAGWKRDEEPVHTVYLDAFLMDETEVTNAMYAAFLNDQRNRTNRGVQWLDDNDNDALIAWGGGTWKPKSGYADHPVIEVTWFGAKAYCEWVGRRLPTEAEWEKAARGGLEGKKYPWGSEEAVCTPGSEKGAKYYYCRGQTVPVMTYAPNDYGLYDLAGNAWEWVADWYEGEYYDSTPTSNPRGPAYGDNRVLRGGGWYHYGSFLRVSHRYYADPTLTNYTIGFRCANSDPSP